MRLICFLLLLLMASCSQNNTIPDNVLPPEKMQEVLVDLMLADEYITNHVSRDTSIKRDSASYAIYQKVFSIHKIDKKTFETSMDFYELNPDILKPVLDSIEASRQPPAISPVDMGIDSLNMRTPKKLPAN